MNDILRPQQKPKARPPVVPPERQPVPAQPPKMLDSSHEQLLEPPKKRRRLGKWIAGILLVLLLLVATAAAAGYFWYKDALQPVGSGSQKLTVKVEQGDSIERTAQKLQDAGAVKSALATQVYIRLHDKGDIKTGQYVFEPNQSVPEIVDWLNQGKVDTFKVTILPGKTLQELHASLVEYGYTPAEIDEALDMVYEHALFKDAPPGTGLEGYIYPETYFVTTGSSAAELFVRSFDEFEKQITKQGIRDKLAARNLTLHQGVILASLVSGEVSGLEDRRKVAQVFEKRLNEDMLLGSDVSFTYAAKQLGVEPSPSIDSPYNTRKVLGLPPGPVSNFTLEALQAVAEPSNTSYLYFVSGDDGVNRFAFTAEEHEQNVQKYCRKLCGLE